jgi:hypothetical protein
MIPTLCYRFFLPIFAVNYSIYTHGIAYTKKRREDWNPHCLINTMSANWPSKC